MISVVIPAREEPYLAQTVDGLLANAAGEVEIVVVFDGWACKLPDDRRIKKLYFKPARGLRAGMEAAVKKARGKHILKLDAHCQICEGYDEILAAECADNWIVIPRRYGLDAENWRAKETAIDYECLLWPYSYPNRPPVLAFRPWVDRQYSHERIQVDETMGFQGSCYFMERAHWNRMGGLSDPHYGSWKGEPEELAFKTHLGPWDGRVMVNKKAWYAHWTKPKAHWFSNPGRIGYISDEEWQGALAYMFEFWWMDRWKDRAHDFDWLIDKFWPLPKWPADWREKYEVRQ